MKALLEEYSDVFAMDASELGHSDVVKHTIDTGDSRPIKQRPYRTPFAQREKISHMIEEMVLCNLLLVLGLVLSF